MPKIVELRQDRSFVHSNFDGYKLSLDAVPVIRQETVPARNAKPSEDQYSFLHVELFSMQNLLQADPWERNTAYYVNFRGEVTRCHYDENTGRPETPQVVYNMVATEYGKGDYNCSMRFISEKYCVICDGKRQVYLLDTGDRRKISEWNLVSQATVSNEAEEPNFMLYDCRLDVIQEQKQISLAIGSVQQTTDSNSDGSGSAHFLRLHWAKWVQKDTIWEFQIAETLEGIGGGSLYYCAFEPRAESLIISSNRDFHFKSKESKEHIDVEMTIDKPQLHGESNSNFDFNWKQSSENIVVEFALKEGIEKKDLDVKSTPDRLTVKCGEETLLEEVLFEKIDEDLTTYTIERNLLEVNLTKKVPCLWSSILVEGKGPKEKTESNGTNIPAEQQPIANLEAPIEDCDFPIGSMEYEVKIDRFNLPSKEITHSVLLGSTPPLFSTNLRPGFPLAIATRQDVDACLWLQQYNPNKPDEWSLRHEGNLHAFGYVQASKQQRKFMDCAPDLSYAVICESFRHVFLYKMNYETANGLRNRNGPQVTLGKQHLITLDDTGEVLGVATASSVVILLTEKCLLYLQIN